VISYATATGPTAVEPLVRALHAVDNPALHRRLCDALIAVAGDTLPTLLDRFDVDHPEVALDAVYIARTLELETLPARLRELVFYPDPRVKLEMLEWIAGRDDADSTELLLASLNDLDKRVRLKVLDVLCGRRLPRVRERLTEAAFGKELAERSADEQEAVFKALGHVGDAQTVVHLRALVEKRRLLSLGKGPDAKHLAIRALERIHDPAALDLLGRLAQDPNEAVRMRAQRARETLAATLASAPAGASARAERRP
jgi:HEAT repeat protein